MSNKEQHRVLPLETQDNNILQDKSIDLQIYELFQIKSYITKDKIRFCYKSGLTQQGMYNEYKKSYSDNNMKCISFNTFRKYWKTLFDKGMIINGEVIDKSGKEKVKAYILPQDYKTFQFVPLKTMQFLANATNRNVINIYGYLLNKSKYKENYTFTLKELVVNALGYNAETSGIEQKAKDCLSLLEMIGLIEYIEIYELNADNKPVPKKKIIRINTECTKTIGKKQEDDINQSNQQQIMTKEEFEKLWFN
jgi:hypothetical protein